MLNITKQIASELSVAEQQIEATIKLISEGATIPFIARYRKEVTGGLNDAQLREFETRYIYLNDLEDRKKTILKAIIEQNKLTPELEKKINLCLVKSELEDLYLPFKPKRQTKATEAREAGLEPLALNLFYNENPALDVDAEVQGYIQEKYPNKAKVLEACLYILMENFAENADLLKELKQYLTEHATMVSKVVEAKKEVNTPEVLKFKDYFEFSESIKTIKSHRLLALLRGASEKILKVTLESNPNALPENPAERIIRDFALAQKHIDLEAKSELNEWRNKVLTWTWKVKLAGVIETDLIAVARERAELESIEVFSANLKSLLLTPPAKAQVVLGLDPGLRTGIKAAVIDETSKVVATETIQFMGSDYQRALKTVSNLIDKYKVTLVSIGNGTASRQTEKLVEEVIEANNLKSQVTKVVVNEAGASIYSASKLADKEFPDLDVSLRGAVSIARRLQDPLAEFVKIEPKSIGVGQYQHDLNKHELERKLDTVVEDCVNFVGVNVNTASTQLLERVSGVKKNIAASIIDYRDQFGAFLTRKDLLKVKGLGAKAFELCAGFLRVLNGENPLDNSSVHPESYKLVEKMAKDLGVTVIDLIGNNELIAKIDVNKYVAEGYGLETVMDVKSELVKPGQDPRGSFEPIKFRDDISELKDVTPGMILDGIVLNVVNFGAFVDVGIKTYGLVHVSALSDQYIESPIDFIKPGEHVKVQVVKVDLDADRLELTMNFEGQTKKAPITAKPKREKKSAEDKAKAKAEFKAKAKTNRAEKSSAKAEKAAEDKSTDKSSFAKSRANFKAKASEGNKKFAKGNNKARTDKPKARPEKPAPKLFNNQFAALAKLLKK